MITIGVQMGGPEQKDSPIENSLMKAMNIAADTRESNFNDGSEAWINPIFIVPGSILKPEFEGYKLGHFSRKRGGLVVMIAVPQSVADGDGVAEFIGTSLREAVRVAATRFAARSMSFSTLKAERIILAIEAGLKK